jgi:hypothetical protein
MLIFCQSPKIGTAGRAVPFTWVGLAVTGDLLVWSSG